MEFQFTQEEQEIIREVRAFIKKEATPELLQEAHEMEYIYGGPEGRKFTKKFAANGWLVPAWPQEYGGLGASEMVTYIIRNEMAYAGVPWSFAGAHMAGPSILRHGNEEMKQAYLSRLASGEIEFALGYSEPQAGSDLLGLQMLAEDKGDHYLVNGQKTFNTHTHVADYHWLAARTNINVAKHKGISIFVVDLKTPGITVRPMITMAGSRTNEVYYDNVKVPKNCLVGEENMGYKYILVALDFERMFPFGHYQRYLESLIDYAKKESLDGEPLSRNIRVRDKLAGLATQMEVLRLLYFNMASILDAGKVPNYQASMEKTYLADLSQELASTGMDILGMVGQVKSHDERAVLEGMTDYLLRWTVIETIYGGSSEIQRSIMAQRALGLPRA